MNRIDGDAKTIRQLLSGAKYTIDYYQREYRWETKQVTELLEDLVDKFDDDWRETHELSDIENYGHYFLGSIIISHKDGQNFVIDGQQRLTTLTLLLIHLNILQQEHEDKASIDDLIFSDKFGHKSFNLDVDERRACMDALFAGTVPDENGQPESVQNILRRFADIQGAFPYAEDSPELIAFIYWLIENVHLVEITAYSDEDAYTIFETMNDRGLSLRATDMLKGYLLANIKDSSARVLANEEWKRRIERFRELGGEGKEEDADFFKAWLRSQYAETIREGKKGAKPGDYDRIGTEFHRWVRDRHEHLGLKKSADSIAFIQSEMSFYARQYVKVRKDGTQVQHPFERVYSNWWFGFSMQPALLFAPLAESDDESTITKKVRIMAAFLDIWLARRLWNYRSMGQSTIRYTMFQVMKDARRESPEALATVLRQRLDSEAETFASNDAFRLHGMNRWHIHHLLARMTEFIEVESGLAPRYPEYATTSGKKENAYEVEHIWADLPEAFAAEFPQKTDFAEHRNRIGGLLLLPKSFNASYGALPYEEKLPHYFGQNLLAKSLHPQCYVHNPGFLAFVERSGLPFEPVEDFDRAALERRQVLYRLLAEQVWNPAQLLAPLEEEAAV
jgi:Protein of unknown function DUF262/Protein of unknown function (DUF1524)